MPKKKKPSNKKEDVCLFCSKKEKDELRFGKILRLGKITVHYFCMLFSNKLVQRGKEDDDGILGFLPKDILREQHRGSSFRCNYCKESGATLRCAVTACKRVYHLPCGLKNNSLQQFFDTFRSFCSEHRPKQELKLNCDQTKLCSICPICKEAINQRVNYDVLRSPCCKSSLFHRICLQQQALNAGAFYFKCCLCNDKDLFQTEMLTYGIYIPEQDASWELEANAYQELLHRHNRCDHPECKCPEGREHNADGSRWEIILCGTCGSQGVHIQCGSLRWCNPSWECSGCSDIAVGKEEKESEASTSQPNTESSPENTRRSKKSSSRKRKRKSRKKSPDDDKRHCTNQSTVLRELKQVNTDNNEVEVDIITIEDDDDDDDNPPRDENKSLKFERVDSTFKSDDKRIPKFSFDASSSIVNSSGNSVRKSESFTIPTNFASPEVIQISDSDSESLVTSEVDPNCGSYSNSPKPTRAVEKKTCKFESAHDNLKFIAESHDMYAPGAFGNWSSEDRFCYSGSPYVEVNMVPVSIVYDSS